MRAANDDVKWLWFNRNDFPQSGWLFWSMHSKLKVNKMFVGEHN